MGFSLPFEEISVTTPHGLLVVRNMAVYPPPSHLTLESADPAATDNREYTHDITAVLLASVITVTAVLP